MKDMIYSNRYNDTKQTRASSITNWIATFDYSVFHTKVKDSLTLENFGIKSPYKHIVDIAQYVLRLNPLEDGAISGFSGQNSVPE